MGVAGGVHCGVSGPAGAAGAAGAAPVVSMASGSAMAGEWMENPLMKHKDMKSNRIETPRIQAV